MHTPLEETNPVGQVIGICNPVAAGVIPAGANNGESFVGKEASKDVNEFCDGVAVATGVRDGIVVAAPPLSRVPK
jgi:hypothetical protein